MNGEEKYRRYQRQILLKEFGKDAQEKLFRSSVLVIGAGGLGCPALQYLAAAGVGKIGVVDFDIVDISNLQRQVLYTESDVGKPKAACVSEKLKAFNPGINIEAFNQALDTKNAISIIKNYDVVIDGTDNFATRYLVNDACVILSKPLVYGSVLRFEGQVGVFNLADKKTGIKTNYRHLFPVPPDPGTVPSCNEAGVLGIVPGIIGTMQAAEAIKIITGIGEALTNKIVCINALNVSFHEFELSPMAENKNPLSSKEFENFDYDYFCNSYASVSEMLPLEFEVKIKQQGTCVIDVREKNETAENADTGFLNIPLSAFESSLSLIEKDKEIILVCASGQRSAEAWRILKRYAPKTIAHSLKGGLKALNALQTP